MKHTWIKQSHSRRLILIFAGWSTGPEFYSTVERDGWDVLVCYDYSDLSFNEGMLADYDTVALFAWSLGVFAASHCMKHTKPAFAVAISGSVFPCDDDYGIPKAIYRGTCDGLSERTLLKFRKRMLDSSSLSGFSLPQEDDIEHLKAQLRCVEEESGKIGIRASKDEEVGADKCSIRRVGHVVWSRVFIGQDDRIFPPKNLLNFWQTQLDKSKIVELEAGHYIDFEYILAVTMPDSTKVGASFSVAAECYDQYATAQHIISTHLTDMVIASKRIGESFGRVLEIGQGTGAFSRMVMPELQPGEIDFVDLYSTPQWHLAAHERFHIRNAEHFLVETEGHWDAIVSASAIQWFSNLKGFFANAKERLKEGGLLACSTFSQGNLSELDGVRPSPLIYLTLEEITDSVKAVFDSVKVESELVVIRFKSAKEALIHLKRTGVSVDSAKSKRGVAEILKAVPKDEAGNYYLTYRPVYIIARK